MTRFLFLFLFVFCLMATNAVYAQNAQTKTDELIAALAKTKYKKKEKKDVFVETYVDIKSEAVVKSNIQDYSGVYKAGSDYLLELRVSADGKIEGNGFDHYLNSKEQNFTLKDARIEGALLTATKVFKNGETLKLEAVFNNRTVAQGKNPNEIDRRETKFGLGFIQVRADWTNRVFLEFK